MLRLVVEENEVSIEELLDCSAAEALVQMREAPGRLVYSPGGKTRGRDLSDLRVTAEGVHGDITVKQLENGTILVERNGVPESPAKPALRTIAKEIGVDVLNANGNPKNTRALGADILTALSVR